MTPEEEKRKWRVGSKVSRNLYRGDEPIAMLAIAELAAELAESLNAVDTLREALKEKEQQLTWAQENNHRRNVELDALHYVWCDGGCESGIHRFGEHPPLTAEIVARAMANAQRLRKWYVAHAGKELPGTTEARIPAWQQAQAELHAAEVQQLELQLASQSAEIERLVEELSFVNECRTKLGIENDKFREAIYGPAGNIEIRLGINIQEWLDGLSETILGKRDGKLADMLTRVMNDRRETERLTKENLSLETKLNECVRSHQTSEARSRAIVKAMQEKKS